MQLFWPFGQLVVVISPLKRFAALSTCQIPSAKFLTIQGEKSTMKEVQEMAHLTVLTGGIFAVTACKKLWAHPYLKIIFIYRKNSMNFNSKIRNLSVKQGVPLLHVVPVFLIGVKTRNVYHFLPHRSHICMHAICSHLT